MAKMKFVNKIWNQSHPQYWEALRNFPDVRFYYLEHHPELELPYTAQIGPEGKAKNFKTMEGACIWATKELEHYVRGYLADILTLRAELEGKE